MKNSNNCLNARKNCSNFSTLILVSIIYNILLVNSVCSNEISIENIYIAVSVDLGAKGADTGRPLPRYATLKSEKVNLRRGPGKEFQIDWVYYRKHLPVRIILEYQRWRKIEDFEGYSGWVHASLLSGKKSLIVIQDAPLKAMPQDDSITLVYLQKNVLLNPKHCEERWCKVKIHKYNGWISKKLIWGGF